MRLLPPGAFAHVFEPLQGKRIGFIRPKGNVGDALIEWATRQLFDEFGIDWKLQDPDAIAADVDELVFGGGGNMGSLYRRNWDLRTKCLQLGRPLTILPQSYTTAEKRPFERIYVRERASLQLEPRGILAPDLALGLSYTARQAPTHDTGVFLRKDVEGAVRRGWFRRDPIQLCRTPQEYLELAARYRHVITDRLHFAISSLIVGRRATLLPNSYHKNISMYETWLRGLGCEFAGSVEVALKRKLAS